MPWFHWEKNEWLLNSPDHKQVDYHYEGHDAGISGMPLSLSEIRAKTVQHCWAEDCLAIDMEWFAIQEFIDKAISSFRFESDFDRVLLQLVDIFNAV